MTRRTHPCGREGDAVRGGEPIQHGLRPHAWNRNWRTTRLRVTSYGAGPMAASALSNQKFIPISRYIVAPVVKCS